MSDIYIKQLSGEAWRDYKFIRLKALQECPAVYCSCYDKTLQLPDSFWQEPLDSNVSAVFGVYDGNNIIGLASVFTWREDPTGKTAIFVMDFIDKSYRGQGLTKLIYESRLKWARERNGIFDKAAISHRKGNEASRRAMVSFGFQLMDKKMIDWPDGQKDWEYSYELQL
jgi:GNAT superfamily N-acetyltransferase